ncbi:unnamed protein product [Musa textilis]
MAAPRTPPPPPLIGKAGCYTIFITPPTTPTPSELPRSPIASPAPSLRANNPEKDAPSQAKAPSPLLPPPPIVAPPPVQVPPLRFEKPVSTSSGSVFGFFWDAVAEVQDAHSKLDDYLADWFGLNHSKYQWALNEYYEHNEKVIALLSLASCLLPCNVLLVVVDVEMLLN